MSQTKALPRSFPAYFKAVPATRDTAVKALDAKSLAEAPPSKLLDGSARADAKNPFARSPAFDPRLAAAAGEVEALGGSLDGLGKDLHAGTSLSDLSQLGSPLGQDLGPGLGSATGLASTSGSELSEQGLSDLLGGKLPGGESSESGTSLGFPTDGPNPGASGPNPDAGLGSLPGFGLGPGLGQGASSLGPNLGGTTSQEAAALGLDIGVPSQGGAPSTGRPSMAEGLMLDGVGGWLKIGGGDVSGGVYGSTHSGSNPGPVGHSGGGPGVGTSGPTGAGFGPVQKPPSPESEGSAPKGKLPTWKDMLDGLTGTKRPKTQTAAEKDAQAKIDASLAKAKQEAAAAKAAQRKEAKQKETQEQQETKPKEKDQKPKTEPKDTEPKPTPPKDDKPPATESTTLPAEGGVSRDQLRKMAEAKGISTDGPDRSPMTRTAPEGVGSDGAISGRPKPTPRESLTHRIEPSSPLNAPGHVQEAFRRGRHNDPRVIDPVRGD